MEYFVEGPYITLGQLLKELSVISSGGMAKYYLEEENVYVDGLREQRRGRKLYDGMVIMIPEIGEVMMKTAEQA